MMRVILISAVLACVAAPAFAEDDFGARFSAQAPAALREEPAAADETAAPQDIEPAAGAEDSAQTPPAAVPLSDDIGNKSEEDANEIETSL